MYCIRKRDDKTQSWVYLCHVNGPGVYCVTGGKDWRIISPMTRTNLVDFEQSKVGECLRWLDIDCQLVKLEDGGDISELPVVRLENSFIRK